MLTPHDIKTLCERKYPAYLRTLVTGEAFFPLPIRFGRPSGTDDFATLQRDITALYKANLGCDIESSEINTQRWGRQRLPQRITFTDEAKFLSLLGKAHEAERFRQLLALTRDRCPAALPWLADNSLSALEHSDVWPELLTVCDYFINHPRPRQYSRELPIPVDTKFIERHQIVLRSLLDTVLPEDVRTSSLVFEERYGLRTEEPQIRFRLLDPTLKQILNLTFDDQSVPAPAFHALTWQRLTVVVAENRRTFLSLPPLTGTLALWGAGNAAELLTPATWLADCRLIYWGDLDVHGFHILSRLRRTFPSIASVMMDPATLAQHRGLTAASPAAAFEDTTHLTHTERRAYEIVRADRIVLEQEKIPHAYAVAQLARAAVLAISHSTPVNPSSPSPTTRIGPSS